MKIHLLIFSLCLCLFTSCNEKFDHQEEVLHRIVEDEHYLAYKEALNENAQNIMSGLYDLESVHEIVESKSNNGSICDMSKKYFISIKGGLEYHRIHCEIDLRFTLFRKKFPEFDKLNDEQLKELQELYFTRNPKVNF